MAVAEKTKPGREPQLLSRPLFAEFTINWELVAYGSLLLFAVATRFWDLGSRAMHHDESLHALYSWYLYVGKGYVHDPMMHGPFQFHAVALIFLLFGASDYTARVLPAILGCFVVISPYFLRREMGRGAALVAAALFAVSPSFLYFSRFIRNDIYMAAWAMMMLIGLFGFLREKKAGYLYLAALGATLSYATKETVYITGFVFVMFFVVEAAVATIRRRTPTGLVLLRSASAKQWSICVALFLIINLLLYTTFFTNPKGVASGAYGALSYWLQQQGVQRGGQPWFYYLMLIPLYEFLPVMSALGGLVFMVVRRQLFRVNLFTGFVIFWLVGCSIIYSWAGEKMPWLDLHMAQPLILLAAMAIAGLFKRAGGGLFTQGPGLWSLALAGLIAAAALGGLVAYQPAQATQLNAQSGQLQTLGVWFLIAALLFALFGIGRRNGSRMVLVPASAGFLAVLLVLTVRTAWAVNYERSDTPRDMLVYVQSAPDVPRVVKDIERISNQTGTGKDMKILLDAGYTETVGGQPVIHESIAWPFEWYLRDYKNKSYYAKTFQAPADAPVILAMTVNEDPIRDSLSNYVGQRGRLNWWYPEDYKTLTLEKVWTGIQSAETRGKLWRYFLYKETLNPLGSRDFDYFVRSDLARGMAVQSSTGVAPQAVPSTAVDAVAQPAEGGITIYGKSLTGAGAIGEPKGVAVSRDGLIYTVDSAAAQVVAFAPDGSVAYQWGKKGSGDGEFSEPWGIAVSPSGDVYVADTWNHRVQKFDSSGKFLSKWGGFVDAKGQLDVQPGSFWGPRAIAVAPNGKVYVTDTGNKRVEVFDGNGKFLSMFGGDGTEAGKFKEPVGIAVDGAGNIYVADTWNKRVQKFDPQQKPIAQFAAPGWDSQSIVNKPYLAVDQDGRVVYTEPEKNRFVVIGPDGQQIAARGKLGSDPSSLNLPIGVVVSPDGALYIGDSRNGRVVKYDNWR